MSDHSKILVLFADDEHKKTYDKVKGVKEAVGDVVFKTTTFDQFQEDKRVDKFDFAIAFAQEVSNDDFEMQTDFWKHYSIAPVFAVLYREASEEFIKQNLSDSAICVKSENEASYNEDLISVINQCKELYQKKLNEDVVPSFNQFDKDQSGAIDVKELQALMKALGQEIDEEQA